MSDFIAKRDLPPDQFAIFSKQHTNDYERSLKRIAETFQTIQEAQTSLKWLLPELERNKEDMRKHGVEFEE